MVKTKCEKIIDGIILTAGVLATVFILGISISYLIVILGLCTGCS